MLTVVAPESGSLSPARRQLAELLAQRDRLRGELEPFTQRLQHIDAEMARRDAMMAHVRVLEVAFEEQCGEALSHGRELPLPPTALEEARQAALHGEIARRGAGVAREKIQALIGPISAELGRIGAEIVELTVTIEVEAYVSYAADGPYSRAYKSLQKHQAVIDGGRQHLIGQGEAGLRGATRLDMALGLLHRELGGEREANLRPARRLAEALGRDPAAQLEAE